MVKELLGALDVPVAELEGWEGDDILGTLARRGEAAGYEMYLFTGDRDMYQLATDNVRIVSTKKGVSDVVIMDPESVDDLYHGIAPELVPDFYGLKGDSSDNIPGVPGIGPKKASQLIVRYGSSTASSRTDRCGARWAEPPGACRRRPALARWRPFAPARPSSSAWRTRVPDFDQRRSRRRSPRWLHRHDQAPGAPGSRCDGSRRRHAGLRHARRRRGCLRHLRRHRGRGMGGGLRRDEGRAQGARPDEPAPCDGRGGSGGDLVCRRRRPGAPRGRRGDLAARAHRARGEARRRRREGPAARALPCRLLAALLDRAA